MIKLPKSIKIGAHRYKIKSSYYFQERNDLIGQIKYETTEIKISNIDINGNTMSDSQILNIFLHETLHGIDYNSAYTIFENDEKKIEQCAQALTQVFIDNKWKW